MHFACGRMVCLWSTCYISLNMKSLKFFACVASSLFLFTSCHTMTDIFGSIYEPTKSVSATVEHASVPKYHAEISIGKGKGKITLEGHYEQKYYIITEDGRRLCGTHTYGVDETDKQLYTGSRGQAIIGVKSAHLKSFNGEENKYAPKEQPIFARARLYDIDYASPKDRECMLLPYEQTESVRATVEQASKPKYYKRMNAGSSDCPMWIDAHYTQKIHIRTEDGRELSGIYSYDRGEDEYKVSVGSQGVATIGKNTGKLLRFEIRFQ